MSDTVKNPLVNQTVGTTFDGFVEAMSATPSKEVNPDDIELSIIPSDFTKGVVSAFNAITKPVTDLFSRVTAEEKQKNDIENIVNDDNINFQDNKGRSALHWAVMNENPVLAEFLIRKNINPELQDEQGRTAFHYLVDKLEEKPVGMAVVAQLNNKQDLLSIFKNNQMNLSVTDNTGKNVLHLLAEKSNFYVMSALLTPNKGADYNWNADAAAKVQDELGNTPLHYAAKNGNMSLISALSKYSKTDLKNNEGKTPLDLVHPVYKDQVATLLSQKTVETPKPDKTPMNDVAEKPVPAAAPVVKQAIVVKSNPSWMDRIKQIWDAVLTWFKGQEEDRKEKYVVKALDVSIKDMSGKMTDGGKKTTDGIKQQPVPLSKVVPPVVTIKADSTSDNEENFKPKLGSKRDDYWVQP